MGWTVRKSNPGEERDFPHLSRPALGPTQLPVQWYRVFPGGKQRPGRDADPSPLLVPWPRKSRAISLLPLCAIQPGQSHSTCTRVTFTITLQSAFGIISTCGFCAMEHVGQVTYRTTNAMYCNVILRCVRATVVEVERQYILHILSVCLYP
jgi:hypothetical protein